MSADNGFIERISNLEAKMELLISELEVVKRLNTSLKLQIENNTRYSEDLYDTLCNLEYEVNKMNQYLRHENIELQNIPESVVQDDLEKFVINLFKEIKLDISSYDLVAVHQLGKTSSRKSRNVIVRFLNRKSAFACLLNAKLLNKSSNLMYKKIFITENLCPINKKIFNRLYKMKKEKSLFNVWSFQGHVYFKFSDSREERPIHIKHPEDIDYYFNKES